MLRILGLLALVILALPLAPAAMARAARTTDAVADGLSAVDWAGIRSACEAGQFAARATDGGWLAQNPDQRWRTSFDRRGFTVRPDEGGWSWGLELVSYGFPGHERLVTTPESACADGGRIAYGWDDTLEEWYVNDARGIEHGYTLRRRPGGGAGRTPLTLALTVRGGLVPVIGANGRDARFVDAGGAAALTYSGLVVFDADGRELPARLSAAGDGVLLTVDERVARYPLTIDPVVQQAYLKASNPGEYDHFGYSVALSGNTLVVGARYEASSAGGVNGDQDDDSAPGSGAAYVFVKRGKQWAQQAYLKAATPGAGDSFGCSVAVSGDTIVVGAKLEDSASSSVGGDQSDNGAPESGAAYVFVRTGSAWSQQVYLKASNAEADDEFGSSVAISGDRIVVGAPNEDAASPGIDGDQADNSAADAGAAYVFARSGSAWSQEAYLKSPDPEGPSDACSVPGPGGSTTSYYGHEYFGASVAIDGDTIVVGARGEDGSDAGVNGDPTLNGRSQSGAAFVFVRTGSQTGTPWSQEAYLKASNPGGHYYNGECWGAGESHPGDQFGTSVSVSGDTIVVGAPKESSSATGVNGDQEAGASWNVLGAAYVFVRTGSQTGTPWSQEAYLKASNTELSDILFGDGFGASVAVSGDVVVVGAPGEDSGAAGVNGDGADNSAEHAGAAYLFLRSGSVWSHHAYLKASNPTAFDNFSGAVNSFSGVIEGFDAVAVDGATAVIGAPKEDSQASGVNGEQGDDSVLDSGAVYVFAICPSGSAAEVVRAGSPANPTALLPGQTSGPVLGEVWDPVIDHTTFLPTAVFDFLILATSPLNVPTEFGTLLCAPALYTFVNAASMPFGLPIPPDCSLVGASFCFQGASWDGTAFDATSLQLTNALDITIGTP